MDIRAILILSGILLISAGGAILGAYITETNAFSDILQGVVWLYKETSKPITALVLFCLGGIAVLHGLYK